MKIVVDTNVLVAALVHPSGPCGRLLDLVLDGVVEACVDARLIAEYSDVLRRPKFRLSAVDVESVVASFWQSAIPLSVPPLNVILPDPDDLPFLEVAAAGNAILVTGNRRHFPKQATSSVVVLKVRNKTECEFERLDEVWQVLDDPVKLRACVTAAVRSRLERQGAR